MSHNAGRSNPRAILTEPEVIHARNLARAGARVRELAALFGARRSAIWLAVTGRTWAHLPGAVTELGNGRSGGKRVR